MSYRVSISSRERTRLLHWNVWSKAERIHDEFLRALNIINYRLSNEPTGDWSEPYIYLESLELQLRFGAQDMLGVAYGVHEKTEQVFVKQFHWIGSKKPPEATV
jgi:hypothetical protein